MQASGVLTVNVGSSSLKLRLYSLAGGGGSRDCRIEKIGSEAAEWKFENEAGETISGQAPLPRAADAAGVISGWLGDARPTAIAHRFVHGGATLTQHVLIDNETLATLRRTEGLAPEHLPAELEMLETMQKMAPDAAQVACFDTAFHATLPEAARTYALPARLRESGVRRFGFHGLSYEYLVSWLAERGLASGRSVCAHLGNGASMAAVLDGVGVDTTMGLTPTGGLVMGTRSGDLDPGIFRFLAAEIGLSPAQIDRELNHESGLRGLSGTSADVRDLLAAQATDPRAALALEVFCHSAKKHLAALAAVLGGLDRIVFTGGIGEHSPEIRAKILSSLEFLGLEMDAAANAAGHELISSADSRATIHVVPANEEASMYRAATRLLDLPTPSTSPSS